MIVAKYMVIFRGMLWDKDLSPEEIQTVASRWTGSFDRLTQHGKVISNRLFAHQGAIVSCKKGKAVVHDRFPESKEAILGYMLLEANNLSEAVKIAQECSSLGYGASAEIRPVAERDMSKT
jgi:hypothetical protein